MIAFDPKGRSWVTRASAQSRGSFDDVPPLDGKLLLDDLTLEAFADDWGHYIHHRPVAVLKPNSVQDIVMMVRFANRHCLEIAMRGQGHATLGNAQVSSGIVVDSTTEPLSSVRIIRTALSGKENAANKDAKNERSDDFPHGVRPGRRGPVAVVGPGALWGAVWDAADLAGLRTPVTTDVNIPTVGGTLSTGGLGGTTFAVGMQVDHVLELEVVTGRGDLVTCSLKRNKELFNAVLGGQGQCGIVVRAVIPLVPAPTHVNFYRLTYTNLESFVNDQLLLARKRTFDHIYGRTVASEGGVFNYVIEAGAFYGEPDVPDEAGLLAGLRFTRRTLAVMTHKQYYNRGNADLQGLRNAGRYSTQHSWFLVFVPASKFLEFAGAILSNPGEVQFALPRMVPYRTSALTAPLMRLPMEEEFAYALLLARNPPPGFSVTPLDATNREIYERARSLGGSRMTWGSIPMSQADWKLHYGPMWNFFHQAKKRFDPNNVLTPGPGIFPPIPCVVEKRTQPPVKEAIVK